MDYIKGTWANDGTIENLGWLAVALVIFATWKPTRAIWGSYLFRNLFWAYLPSDRFRIDKAVTGVVQDAALYRYNNRTHYCFAAQEKGRTSPRQPSACLISVRNVEKYTQLQKLKKYKFGCFRNE